MKQSGFGLGGRMYERGDPKQYAFQLGQIVTHKSRTFDSPYGNPHMVVADYIDDPHSERQLPRYVCAWFSGGSPVKQSFYAHELRAIDDTNGQSPPAA